MLQIKVGHYDLYFMQH